jgi:acetoin utilization deacetylase AcuC-like enzyme
MTDLAVIRSPIFMNHLKDIKHPENPRRMSAILSLFEKEPFKSIPTVAPKSASESDLRRVHATEMIRSVLEARGVYGEFDGDTPYTPDSVDTALFSAGSCIDLALRIWRGEFRRGFSLVRPPGHHAVKEHPMGFCLFNNAALAAAALLAESPDSRIAIVDYDLHHGNGTQWIFYDDPRVLFLSSHRFPYYPGTGAISEMGEGRGKGTTLNFPLGKKYGDPLFVELYRDLVLPVLEEFRPEMIIVSAGFDGHVLDPMSGFEITTSVFSYLSEILIYASELSKGKILFCLEGGYNPDALRDSVAGVLERMLGLPREKFALSKAPVSSAQSEPVEKFRKFARDFFPGV